MIAEIIKAPTVSGMVEYNEQKVEEGHAVRIHDSTLSGTASGIKSVFNNNVSMNDKLRSNKFQHIIVSFHESDEVSTSDFFKIWEDYTESMGYKDFNHVIYQHNDTHLNHFHVVMPTVDVNGTKFSDYKDFVNNRDQCRRIELQHNLHQIIYEGFDKRQQHSLNADKFSIYNLLKRKEVLTKERITIGSSLVNTIRKYKFDNDQVRENFSNVGDLSFEDLKQIADKHIQSNKGQLIKDLRTIKGQSSNYKNFESLVKKEGLYIRRLKDHKSDSYRMVYGNKETGSYIKNSKLPKDLRFDYLFAKNSNEFTRQDQIKFLKNIAIRSSKESGNFQEYVDKLKSFNVDIEVKSNKNGIYAYGLKSLSIPNGTFIPSSEVWRNLAIAKLPFNRTAAIETTAESKTQKPTISKKDISKGKRISSILDNEQDVVQDEIRKAKLRQQERDERER